LGGKIETAEPPETNDSHLPRNPDQNDYAGVCGCQIRYVRNALKGSLSIFKLVGFKASSKTFAASRKPTRPQPPRSKTASEAGYNATRLKRLEACGAAGEKPSSGGIGLRLPLSGRRWWGSIETNRKQFLLAGDSPRSSPKGAGREEN